MGILNFGSKKLVMAVYVCIDFTDDLLCKFYGRNGFSWSLSQCIFTKKVKEAL